MAASKPAQFLPHSVQYTRDSSAKHLKENGIFFTPKNHRIKLWKKVAPFLNSNTRILEPAAGSGEFIQDIIDYGPGFAAKEVTAIEISQDLYQLLSSLLKAKTNCAVSAKVRTYQGDFLDSTLPHNQSNYDIILGNPPYFEIHKSKYTKYFQQYPDWFVGRANIYSLFILRSLQLLSPQGIVAFILPHSWMNGKYFQLLRGQLHQQGGIIHLEDLSLDSAFLKTNQSTVLMIYQKGASDTQYSLDYQDALFYSLDSLSLLMLQQGATTLLKLGAKVETGPVVWNQHKSFLEDGTDTKAGQEIIPLIYYSNLVEGEVQLTDKPMSNGKKQYISKGSTKYYQVPSLILSRGFGTRGTSSYVIKGAICQLKCYTCENHTNVISFPDKEYQAALTLLRQIWNSLKMDKTGQWCRLFLSNGQLSKTEIAQYLPIYLL